MENKQHQIIMNFMDRMKMVVDDEITNNMMDMDEVMEFMVDYIMSKWTGKVVDLTEKK